MFARMQTFRTTVIIVQEEMANMRVVGEVKRSPIPHLTHTMLLRQDIVITRTVGILIPEVFRAFPQL